MKEKKRVKKVIKMNNNLLNEKEIVTHTHIEKLKFKKKTNLRHTQNQI